MYNLNRSFTVIVAHTFYDRKVFYPALLSEVSENSTGLECEVVSYHKDGFTKYGQAKRYISMFVKYYNTQINLEWKKEKISEIYLRRFVLLNQQIKIA